jgi:hypothetical protein
MQPCLGTFKYLPACLSIGVPLECVAAYKSAFDFLPPPQAATLHRLQQFLFDGFVVVVNGG